MSCRSPRNVIVVHRERAPFAAHCERLRSDVGTDPWPPPTPFGRVFTCLYREGRRGIVREPEGIATPPPGKSSERTWSKGREPDIRNVEAEGSSPFTSTKSPVQRAEVGSRLTTRFPACLYVPLRGSEESADERYVSHCRGVRANPPPSRNARLRGRRPIYKDPLLECRRSRSEARWQRRQKLERRQAFAPPTRRDSWRWASGQRGSLRR